MGWIKVGSAKFQVIQPSRGLHALIRDSVTIVYDGRHGERRDELLMGLIEAGHEVPVQVVVNSGEPTPWRLSVFTC